jgi:hypothetical protein
MKKLLLTIITGLLYLNSFSQCEGFLKTEFDKFEKTTRINTPVVENLVFLRKIESGEEHIYLRIEAPASTINIGKTGLKLLLADGKVLNWENAKVEINVNKSRYSSSSYVASTFVELKPEHVLELKKNKITDARLYIYDIALKDFDQQKYFDWFNCLVDQKV